MSAAPPPAALLQALKETLAFEPAGEPAANLTLGKGTLEGRAVRVALVENRLASGSIGKAEVARLVPLLAVATRERSALVLYLDSAGARVSEGLGALGAFRRVFREALAARLAGVPVAVVLGRNCFGGASMLAHVGARRLFAPTTQMAMSGPSILAQGAGADALDEMFRAIVTATIGAPARARACPANVVWEPGLDLAAWLGQALVREADPLGSYRLRHDELRSRLDKGLTKRGTEALRRRELERLFPGGYEARECEGLVTGTATGEGGPEPMLGLVGAGHVTAERAWRFADEAWRLAQSRPSRVQVLLDCESHAARLDDEKAILSEYIVGMAAALSALSATGAHVELTILDRAGGGVYVALASPASRVGVVHGADVQVLPGSAVASILGSHRDAVGDIGEYRSAGVAEHEHKLGIPP